MKIDAIELVIDDPKNPVATDTQGFKNIKMQNLGRVIGITGKNGAGKTRFMNILGKLINHRNSIIMDNGIEFQSRMYLLRTNKSMLPDAMDYETHERQALTQWREKINMYIDSEFNDKITPYYINFDEEISEPQVLLLDDCNFDIKLKTVDEFFSYVNGVFIANYKSLHPNNKWTSDKISVIEEKYKILLDFFKVNFEIKLLEDENAKPIFGGMTIDRFCHAHFSPGQKIMLRALIISDLLENDAGDSIVFWDEPEKNLHPDAMFSLIERILSKRPNSQLWIATHSIALLSYLDSHPEGEVWFMDQGKITKSGRIPERVLSTLMGDNNKCEALQNFVNSPVRYALLRYATECLVPPDSVDTASTDPQLRQIKEIIQKLGSKISLLDYGAGKGRLMKILDLLDDKSIKVEYYAYDKYDSDKDHILKSMQSRGINTENYIDKGSFLNQKHFGKLCIMSNVLHEISPDDWKEVFADDGIIGKFLSEDGYLLIIEDYHLPTGETAHNYGFILPDAEQLKILFGTNSKKSSDFITSDASDILDEHSNRIYHEKYKGRLKAHLVHRKFLKNVNDLTIEKCIMAVKNEALQNIMKVRESGEKNYTEGMRHAFWAMQFANCSLFLNSLTQKSKS